MELQLKNIGMIKEANVKIDGLTVIAGENDTGKSTVGKALYFMIQTARIDNLIKENIALIYFKKIFTLDLLQEKLFMNLITSSENYFYKYNKKYPTESDKKLYNWKWQGDKLYKSDIIFIETPIIWNMQDFFNSLLQIESNLKTFGQEVNIPYPYFMQMLNFQLSTQKKDIIFQDLNKKLETKLFEIINGEFRIEKNKFNFYRNNKKIELINTATGIKSFGLLQVLSKNGWLNRESVLILDEPEVHLHPKWQLEMAKVIVELVKNDVKVLVNSHSPYMIEALKRYSELEKQEDKTNFYLADDGYILYQDNLENIFEKLALPMRELKKLKLKKYLND